MYRIALVVTNVIKVAGLVLGVHAGFGAHPDAATLALSGFMMAGAQLSEHTLIAIIDRFLGRTAQVGDVPGAQGPPPGASPTVEDGK